MTQNGERQTGKGDGTFGKKKLPITINAFIKIGNAAGGGGKVSIGMIITDPPPHPSQIFISLFIKTGRQSRLWSCLKYI